MPKKQDKSKRQELNEVKVINWTEKKFIRITNGCVLRDWNKEGMCVCVRAWIKSEI